MSADFQHATLPSIGKSVLRLGLAGNYGIDEAGVAYAAERGVNFWLWTPRFKSVTPVLRDVLATRRDANTVAVLGNAMLPGGPRRDVENALRTLGVDKLDAYLLGWLGRASRFSPRIQDTLRALVAEGKVTSVGCSIHDRPRAGRLVEDSMLDAFMIRYNAKHPGAEQDIFPHASKRNPTFIAYTATSWGQLLKKLPNISMPPWPGLDDAPPPLTAGLCYRFCLSNPNIHVCLTGPKNRAQFDENMTAFERGPLTDEELAWVRDYGRAVKGSSKLQSLPFELRQA